MVQLVNNVDCGSTVLQLRSALFYPPAIQRNHCTRPRLPSTKYYLEDTRHHCELVLRPITPDKLELNLSPFRSASDPVIQLNLYYTVSQGTFRLFLTS